MLFGSIICPFDRILHVIYELQKRKRTLEDRTMTVWPWRQDFVCNIRNTRNAVLD